MSAFPMLWEEGYDAWRFFGVTGQPSAVLMTSDGTPVKRWSGRIDTEAVLAEVARI